MIYMRCRVKDLLTTARDHGSASASNGRWTARGGNSEAFGTRIGGVMVRHHGTDMLVWNWLTQEVEGIHPGWGSTTDKQGINSMLREVGSSETYDTLFGPSEVGTQGTVMPPPVRCAYLGCERQALPYTTRCETHHTKTKSEPPKVERWTPPLRVEDVTGL